MRGYAGPILDPVGEPLTNDGDAANLLVGCVPGSAPQSQAGGPNGPEARPCGEIVQPDRELKQILAKIDPQLGYPFVAFYAFRDVLTCRLKEPPVVDFAAWLTRPSRMSFDAFVAASRTRTIESDRGRTLPDEAA